MPLERLSDFEYCVWPRAGYDYQRAINEGNKTIEAARGEWVRMPRSESIAPERHLPSPLPSLKAVLTPITTPIHPLLLDGMIRAMKDDDLQFQIEQMRRWPATLKPAALRKVL